MSLGYAFLSGVYEVLARIWNGFLYHTPHLIAAIVLLIVGYAVGWVLGDLVEWLIKKSKIFEVWIEEAGLEKFFQSWDIAHFLGQLTKWYIFILFLGPAAGLVSLPTLSLILSEFALWLPNLIAAIIILLAGIIVGEFFEHKLHASRTIKAHFLGWFAKYAVIILFLLIALDQIGIRVSTANSALLILWAGLVFGVMLAFGLAVGLGMAKKVEELEVEVKNGKIIVEKPVYFSWDAFKDLAEDMNKETKTSKKRTSRKTTSRSVRVTSNSRAMKAKKKTTKKKESKKKTSKRTVKKKETTKKKAGKKKK